MIKVAYRGLAIALLLMPVAGQDPERPSVAEEVVLMPVGPYGEALNNCVVDSFLYIDARPLVDQRGRFSGLVGKDIPYGQYSVIVICDVPEGVHSVAGGVTSTVRVARDKDFLVISSHRFLGHIVPKLRVNVRQPPAISGRMWIKLAGIYLNDVWVANIDATSHNAELIAVQPGDYLLILLAPGKLICTKKIRLLNPWEFHLRQSLTIDAGKACEIVDAKGVTE